MSDILDVVVVFNNPFERIGQLVEEEQATAKPKGSIHVHIVLRLPINAQQAPVGRVNWNQAKG